MKRIKAKPVINYEVERPYCNELIFSDIHDNWDITQCVEYGQKIQCDNCEKYFIVDIGFEI